jgi:hypothetical protein
VSWTVGTQGWDELKLTDRLCATFSRLQGLAKVRLIDASFVWTEPHSKRIRVKLSIQKEVSPMSLGPPQVHAPQPSLTDAVHSRHLAGVYVYDPATDL